MATKTFECHAGFSDNAWGIPTGMQDSEELPDDVPVADAVEQKRTPVEQVPDEEASAEPPDDVPLEAAPADWQEQLETVELDPESDEVDRDNS
jgi:hypothetical protein